MVEWRVGMREMEKEGGEEGIERMGKPEVGLRV